MVAGGGDQKLLRFAQRVEVEIVGQVEAAELDQVHHRVDAAHQSEVLRQLHQVIEKICVGHGNLLRHKFGDMFAQELGIRAQLLHPLRIEGPAHVPKEQRVVDAHLVHKLRGHERNDFVHECAVEGDPDDHCISGLLRTDERDAGEPTGGCLDDADLPEALESFAHRRAGDAELLGELGVADALAGQKATLVHRRQHAVEHQVDDRTARKGLGHATISGAGAIRSNVAHTSTIPAASHAKGLNPISMEKPCDENHADEDFRSRRSSAGRHRHPYRGRDRPQRARGRSARLPCVRCDGCSRPSRGRRRPGTP